VAERSDDTAFRTAGYFPKRRGASLPAAVQNLPVAAQAALGLSVFIRGWCFFCWYCSRQPFERKNAPHIGYVISRRRKAKRDVSGNGGGQFLPALPIFAVVMDGDLMRAKVVAYDRPLKPMEQQAMKEEAETNIRKSEKTASGSPRPELVRRNKSKRLSCSSDGGPPIRPSANS